MLEDSGAVSMLRVDGGCGCGGARASRECSGIHGDVPDSRGEDPSSASASSRGRGHSPGV